MTRTEMAKQALETIDVERANIRDARNAMAVAEAKINLAMAKLHAYFAMAPEETT